MMSSSMKRGTSLRGHAAGGRGFFTPVSEMMPEMSKKKTKRIYKKGLKAKEKKHALKERNALACQVNPKTPATKLLNFTNSKHFMSPENHETTKKSPKQHTPRTAKRIQKQHRDNERNRHQSLNAILRDLSQKVPGHGQCGKETKIYTLKKVISYIGHLEEYAMKIMSEMGVEADFHNLLLLPYLTEEDIEIQKYDLPIQKVTVKAPKRRPADEIIPDCNEKTRKLSSPTIDSTTIEIPGETELGQAYIQLENGEMAPIGKIQQTKDGQNYIVVPEFITVSEIYRGGTIYIPSVVEIEEFPASSMTEDEETASITETDYSSSFDSQKEVEPTPASAALGSPDIISPFSSPQSARTPFIRNTGEATPLLSQTSLSILSSPALQSPCSGSLSHDSSSGTPSKMVDSTTLPSPEFSMPLPHQGEPDHEEVVSSFSPESYFASLSLIRNSKQDVAQISDDSVFDDDQHIKPVVKAAGKKKKKAKQKKKKHHSHCREPASLDPPYVFYDVGKYVNEKRCSRKSNNSTADALFSTDVESSRSSNPYQWKFHDNTAELIPGSNFEECMSPKPGKLDHRKTSWMNGFMMFSRMHRKDFIDLNRGVPTSQISKLLGQTWRSMTREQQEPYRLKAKQYADSLERMYSMAPDTSIKSEPFEPVPSTSEESQSDDKVPDEVPGVVCIKKELVSDDEGNNFESDETNTASECEFGNESSQYEESVDSKCSSSQPQESCWKEGVNFTISSTKFDYGVNIKIEHANSDTTWTAAEPHINSDAVVPTTSDVQTTEPASDHPSATAASTDNEQRVPSAPCRRASASSTEGEPVEHIIEMFVFNDAEE